VARVGGRPEEVVGRELQRPAQRGEPLRLAGDVLRDRQPGRAGGGHVLERVLVGARLEADVVAA
jgi:hypothetical protein